jgi:hypothetical protein
MRSSGLVGCGPQHRQRQPQAREGGFSVHYDEQPQELHIDPGGGRSGPGEHDGQSLGMTQMPGVMVSGSSDRTAEAQMLIGALLCVSECREKRHFRRDIGTIK